MRPDKCLRARSLAQRWGLTPAIAYGLAAIRDPDRAAIIDERGPLTFAEVHRRTDALAHAFRSTGIDHRDTVAIMARNHRGFVEATVACSKLGADILYLDPAATPAAVSEAVRREDPHALIYDEEFTELLQPMADHRRRFLAWCDRGRRARDPVLEDLIAREGLVKLQPPEGRGSSMVTLACHRPGSTSGAGRKLLNSLMVPGAALSKMPLRPRQVTMVGAPMFSSWGFLHFALGMRLASTLVLRREFDPVEVLASIDEHKITALALLPEMLEEIMELPQATIECYTDTLRVIAVQGPTLASELAIPAMERFGDVFYNLYGPAVVRLTGDCMEQTRTAVAGARIVGDVWLGGRAGNRHVARRESQR
jgi:fatty-acyl-CoA synthase